MNVILRALALSLVLVGLTGLALAQDKDKDKQSEPLKGKTQELLIGTWSTEVPLEEGKKIKLTVKFEKDGKFTLTYATRPTPGTYKFTDDETIEVEFKEGEKKSTETMKVKVTGKTLALTSAKGKTQEFKREE